MSDFNLDYAPAGRVTDLFLQDNSFVRGIRGPIGSGKSVACTIELFRRASQQARSAKGIRKTRAAVIRNTFPELKTTTIKTWLDWFPEDPWGKFTWQPPMTHHLFVPGEIDMEVIFLALDRPEDVKKLLSLELTFAWVNEAREVDKNIIDALTGRVGRYPSIRDGGPTWKGIIMDTNAPEDDHWWPLMAGEAPIPEHFSEDDRLTLIKPQNWRFFTQPPAMTDVRKDGVLSGYAINPAAENLVNLPADYYPLTIQGKDRRWIKVYIQNRLGSAVTGLPVFPSFREETHVAAEVLKPMASTTVYVGLDFGLTPAAIFAQQLNGRWFVQGEIVLSNAGAKKLAERVKHHLTAHYPQCPAIITGDPAGDQRAQTDEKTPFQVMRASGIHASPAFSNDFGIRVEAVEQVLTRLVDGRPGFLISPDCRVLKAAMAGRYRYKEVRSSDDPTATNVVKDRFSHPAEAMGYLFMGSGEGAQVLQPKGAGKATVKRKKRGPFGRARAAG